MQVYICRCTKLAGAITARFILILNLGFPFFCNSETVFCMLFFFYPPSSMLLSHCNSLPSRLVMMWRKQSLFLSLRLSLMNVSCLQLQGVEHSQFFSFLPGILGSVLNSTPSPRRFLYLSFLIASPYLEIDVHQLKSKALFFLCKAAFYGGIKGKDLVRITCPYHMAACPFCNRSVPQLHSSRLFLIFSVCFQQVCGETATRFKLFCSSQGFQQLLAWGCCYLSWVSFSLLLFL